MIKSSLLGGINNGRLTIYLKELHRYGISYVVNLC